MRYVIETLGCKANWADSHALEARMRARGWRRAEKGAAADLCVVNSCTVTDEADRESRRVARRLARKNAGARLVYTGCSAKVAVSNAGVLSETRGMDRPWPEVDAADIEGEGSRTRVFFKIQDGCDSFCTFCIIPRGRGPSRSLGIEEAVEAIRRKVDAGAREVILTGINLGDFGVEFAPKGRGLERLIEEILSRTPLERLRVSSLDPTEVTSGLLTLVRSAKGRFCPHFHVSLQSADSRVLRWMKRGYTADQARACLEAIAALPAGPGGAFVGMDVIAGFPGETRAMHEAAMKSLDAWPWTRLHVFPYSERAGTPATRLPGVVDRAERLRRARELQDLSLRRHEAALHRARRELADAPLVGVLWERPGRGPDGGGGWLSGYTPNYLRVMGRGRTRNTVTEAQPSGIVVDRVSHDAYFLASCSMTDAVDPQWHR